MQIYGDNVRFGIHSGQLHGSYDVCVRLWRTAERLGYDWVSLIDHLRPHLYAPDQPCFEGTTLLAALAGVTSRIRCAILVTSATWRHPAVTASVAATIDHISGGRLELGMGAGGPDRAHAQYGLPFPAPRERFERLDEACRILRMLWSQETSTFDGRHFQLSDACLAPKPLQAHLPLVIGGDGLKTRRIAAEHGDIWNALADTPEGYRAKAEAFDEQCAAVGREPADVRRSVTFRAVLVEREEQLPGRAAELLDGVHDEVRAEYLSFGTAEQCVEDLKPYVDLGVRDFLLAVKSPIDWLTVELVATRVAPALKEYAGLSRR
ncbi:MULTISPECIES: LLM class flavin-dependent oxidoreductase [Streptomyces]|uniref:LLM class flavin-dependent oxidoreductase n=1 Tax=Streptomyces flaveolus TaxID=67297 RepID=A0ABV3AEE7_9ACTN|nr:MULTISPECIES: LLM class flavin-dependent oxidoreductase [Streptomyces]KMS85482.1 luciferase [Streptomyces regensis]